jgi:SpoVK/Ycf46/Vps4 family AAA+-type ATPase
MADGTLEQANAFFKDRCARKTKDFANGREARNLLNDALNKQSERLSSDDVTQDEMLTLQPEDIPSTSLEKGVSLEDAMKELTELTGLGSVKDAVTKLSSTLQSQRLKGETKPLNKHFLFYGNPGTGKTTVARIMARVFKALGLLPTDNLIEAKRSTMVAGYVGQTAKLVNKQVDDALGGVLFVDEAYALVQNENDSFGKEAVAELLQRLENDRGKFVAIFAGYEKEMEEFISVNSGFESRFSDKIYFEDYTPDEMIEIFTKAAKRDHITLEGGFDDALKNRMEDLYDNRGANFANARSVRQIYDKSMENLDTRVMTDLNAKAITEDDAKKEILVLRVSDLDQTVKG